MKDASINKSLVGKVGDIVLNRELFGEIYEIHFKRVYNYISYRINNHSDTEDLVSKVFMRVVDKYDLYNPEVAVLEAWIIGIAKNTVNDYFRENKKLAYLDIGQFEPYLADNRHMPEENAIRDENNQSLMAALNKLKDRERHIISLKYAAEIRNKDIASIMNLSESNVGVLLFRSLGKLRDIMEREDAKCRKSKVKNGNMC